jgi:uncharacterized membrane protein (DUF106 family)
MNKIQNRRNKKEKLKKNIEALIMSLGFFFMFGIVIFEDMRTEMGKALDFILSPIVALVGQENFLLVIFFLAIVTGIYTSLIQKYTVDWEVMEKMKEFQRRVKQIQKEYMEAKKENNKHKMKKLERKRVEMMKKQTQFSGEMFRQQMKPMAYISIVTIPIFMWIYWYVGGIALSPVTFPLAGEKELTEGWFIFPYWVLWYLICSIPITQVIRKVLGTGGMA